MTKPLLLSVAQAAEILSKDPKTVRKWIAEGRIESRVGDDGFLKVPLSQLRRELSAEDYAAAKKNYQK